MHLASSPRCSTRPSPRRLRAAMVALGAAFMVSCSSEGTAPEVVASLVVSPSSATIASRAPLPLSASTRTASGKSLSGRPVSWSSSDTAVAKVSASGLVTSEAVLGAAAVTAIITAASEGVLGMASVSVLPVPVATVTATPASASVEVGATQQYSASLVDVASLALTGRTVIWSSSDSLVATVDAAGLVTTRQYSGGATRSATISAVSEGRTGTAILEVRPTAVASLSIATDSVAVGETRLLVATPRDASGGLLWGRSITWTSSDTSIASITAAGLLVPVQRWDAAVRTMTITAATSGIVGTASLTVLPAPVRSITVTPATGTIASGASETLTAVPRSIAGAVLEGRPVTWQSSNPELLAVSADGMVTAGTVTGGSSVSVTITATSDGFSSGSVFSVLPSPVASIAATPDSLSLFPQMTSQLQVAVANSGGAALSGRVIGFSTSDASIVAVSAGGLLTVPDYTGQGVRSAWVIVTSEGHTDSVRVVVEPHRVMTVSLAPNTLMLPAGAIQRVGAVLGNAVGGVLSDRSITWISADPAVATVSDSGVVTLVGNGSTTITATSEAVSATVAVSSMPAAIVPATLVAGAYHHCGLTSTGAAYCWGWNAYGQLGNGSNAQSDRMVAVLGGLTFQQLSAGAMHTCGLTSAGEAYCWGWNANGQLGDGTLDHRPSSTPMPVAGGLIFASVAAGWYHACGLTSTGSAWCWGRNNLGQLGDGTGADHSMPQQIAPGHTFTMLIARYSHTCGLTPTGAAWCWGRNAYGASGDGTMIQANVPVQVLGGRSFTTIAVGWDHTCGITASGATECVGRNQYGQLGDGVGTGGHLDLQPISGNFALRSLHSGYYSMCAITLDGASVCWGRNHLGELGDGSMTNVASPLRVRPEEQFLALGVGYGHTCGVVESGAIHCWGMLLGGTLGEATPPPSDEPLRRERVVAQFAAPNTVSDARAAFERIR